MRKKKIKNYRVPAYPVMDKAAVNPELLEKVPKSWLEPSKLAVLAGLGLLSNVVSGENPVPADSKTPPVVQTPDTGMRKKSVEKQQQNPAAATKSVVVPMLKEALKNDGRGAFGCVVVNPPSFLSEDEALDIIKKELSKVGLKLQEDVTVKNILAPNPAKRSFYMSNEENIPPDIIKTEYEFDFASNDGSILIEYISRHDYGEWKESNKSGSWSSVSSYNFAKIAEKAADSFNKYDSQDKHVFGVFFDPLASVNIPYPSDIKDPRLKKLALEEYSRKIRNIAKLNKEKAGYLLKKQVEYFIQYLKDNKLIQPEK